jgi:hypothetical protein
MIANNAFPLSLFWLRGADCKPNRRAAASFRDAATLADTLFQNVARWQAVVDIAISTKSCG